MALNPCVALRQADQAWFDLNTGAAVREVQDQNGERVVFSSANRAGLLAYISALQTLCPSYTALALGNTRTRPMKFLF
jgi:hypothetical protein